MAQTDTLGKCPICQREMIDDGKSTDRHHFTPKSRGGKETTRIHRICHVKIHSLFTEKELEGGLNTPEALLETEEMQKFVKWVSKKDPTFYDRSIKSKRKRR